MADREHGIVKRWMQKGFGFIAREGGNDCIFCHNRDTPDGAGLSEGSKVSFLYLEGQRGSYAKEVMLEESVVENDSVREMGIIKRWNEEKGFGFIGRASGGDDAFVHKKACGGKNFSVGQSVSFVFEEGPKGASASQVREEDGTAVENEEDDEHERLYGKVKSYNEEKGFAFITPCLGGADIFGHKKEFSGVEPSLGQPVSFIVTQTEKGGTAKSIRQEENVPDPILSDVGREFGRVKVFNTERGFGFITRDEGDEAIIYERQCNGLVLEKNMCVSFALEEGEGDKGPVAKDARLEDESRVKRLKAKIQYGEIDQYSDPPANKPSAGYGFILPSNAPTYGAPARYYFHMSEIVEPDDAGGIDVGQNVSFKVMPARSGKGVQAVDVTIADPPEEMQEEKDEETDEKQDPAEGFAELKVDDARNGDATGGDDVGFEF